MATGGVRSKLGRSKLFYDFQAHAQILNQHNGLVVLKLTETLTASVYKQLNDELVRIKNIVEVALTAVVAELTDQERTEVVEVLTNASNLSSQLAERIDKLKTPPSEGNMLKLPEIKLPTFKGELLEWKAFWATFDALIHSRSNLEPVVKFTYLTSCISGEPKDLIKGLAVTSANYVVAVRLLQDRYENDQKLLHSLLHHFNNLPPPRHDYRDLKTFHVKFVQLKEQIEAITSLTGAEMMIKSIVVQKLTRTTYEYVVDTLRKFDFTLDELMNTLLFLIDRWEYEQIISNETTQVKSTHQNTDVGVKPKRTNETSRVNKLVCHLCNQEHRVVDCTKYKTYNARRDRVRTLRLCFNCLKKGHVTKDCLSNSRCRKCSSAHHTALCYSKPISSAPLTSNSNITSNTSHSNANAAPSATSFSQPVVTHTPTNVTSINTASPVSLRPSAIPTAKVILSRNECKMTTRVFLDSGSQRSFISPKLVEQLQLPVVAKIPIQITTFGSEIMTETLDLVKVKVKLGYKRIAMKLLVHEHASTVINCPGISNVTECLMRNGVRLADDSIDCDMISGIDVLIGVDYLSYFITGQRRIRGVNLFVSSGGLIPFGPLPKWSVRASNSLSHGPQPIVCAKAVCELDPNVERMWDLETVGINKEDMSPVETLTVNQVKASTRQTDKGYEVRLPFKSDERPPVNYRIAKGQLNSLQERMVKNPLLFHQYDAVIQDYVRRDFVELVSNDKIEGHYLPHHPVFKNSSTTPLRIVFNASSKTPGSKSLNDCLFTGPSLTAKLHDALVQFRTGRYAVIADISKAFHRIRIDAQDRPYVKFLWTNAECTSQFTFAFKVVIFGATCSPFLLQQILLTHLTTHVDGRPFVSKFYVDNYQNTYDDENQLLEDKCTLEKVMNEAHMPLQAWASNSPEFNHVFAIEAESIQNVLGLRWDTRSDTLHVARGDKIPIDLDNWQPTKRSFLSALSSVFDPLGLLNPILIKCKIFMQTLWRENLSWDQPLDPIRASEARALMFELQFVDNIEFPRRAIYSEQALHVFVDASTRAYGTVVYSVCQESTNLVLSKARVAPCRENRLTVPKLELTAMLLGCRIVAYLLPFINAYRVYLWTDSKVALAWTSSTKEIKNVFVANRVSEIQYLQNKYHINFLHVPTEENVADILTRGCGTNTLCNSRWMVGPAWLISPSDFPKQDFETALVSELVVEVNPITPVPPLIDLSRFSKYLRALRTTVRVLQFCNLNHDPFETLVKQEQKLHCNSLYSYLTDTNTAVSKDIKQTVKQLSLRMHNNIIRCAGRFTFSELPLDAQTPYFIPNRSRLVILLSLHLHFKYNHASLSFVLSQYRLIAWSPKLRSRLKVALNECYVCRRMRRQTIARPELPPLPAVRTQWRSPFECVGVDHTGHFHVRRDDGERQKAYICLFVCTVTRAVHLEVVTSLSATSFLMCLRRLAATHGTPKVILSDNHRTFLATERFLHDLQHDPEIQDFIAARRIEWRTQTPRSPWSGGHFERLVRTIKVALATAISKKLLTLEEFTTVVKESEAIVNNRPLTYQQVDSQDIPLTPSQLIRGRNVELFPTVITPGPDPDEIDTSRLRHQYVVLSRALQTFQRRWRDEYLTSLREKHRNVCANQNSYELKPGELVLLKVPELSRNDWPLGKVIKVFKDTNGVIRSLEVSVRGEIYRRPVEFVVPLELSCEEIPPPRGETEVADADNNDDQDESAPFPLPSDDMRDAVGGAASDQTAEEENRLPTPDDDVNRDVIDATDDVGTPADESEDATAVQGQPSTPINDYPLTRPVRGAARRQRELLQSLVQQDLV